MFKCNLCRKNLFEEDVRCELMIEEKHVQTVCEKCYDKHYVHVTTVKKITGALYDNMSCENT